MRIYFALLLLIPLVIGCEKEDLAWNLIRFLELAPAQIESNTINSVTISSSCTNDGGDSNTERGICWGYSNDPTVEDSIILSSETGEGDFTIQIGWNNSLDTIRNFRAFARNKVGISYSNNLAILNPILSNSLPTVTSVNTSNVTINSIDIQGAILSNGGLPILEYGVCYSLTNNLPTTGDAYNSIQADYLGGFGMAAAALNDNATYYIRCFARNALGISYGAVLSTTTNQDYNIGDIGPTGGYIFYKKSEATNGWQFLEAAIIDLSSGKWSSNISPTNVTSVNVGAGESNTASILQQLGSVAQAAHMCNAYSQQGATDWFLPTLGELLEMYNNLHLSGLGNFSSTTPYWSSSEDQTFFELAWRVKFAAGSSESYSSSKTEVKLIRPIRAF